MRLVLQHPPKQQQQHQQQQQQQKQQTKQNTRLTSKQVKYTKQLNIPIFFYITKESKAL